MSLVALGVAAHRLDVELLQPLLDPLERGRVRAEHPLEQRREEAGAVERAGIARARDPGGELLEHRNRLVVGRDHPVLADDALERDQLPLVGLVRGVGRDVDVAAVVLEDGTVIRVRQALSGGAVEPERVGDPTGVLLGVAVDVHPEQLPAAQTLGPVTDVVELLDLIPVEEDGFAHPLGVPGRAGSEPARRRQRRLEPLSSAAYAPSCGGAIRAASSQRGVDALGQRTDR